MKMPLIYVLWCAIVTACASHNDVRQALTVRKASSGVLRTAGISVSALVEERTSDGGHATVTLDITNERVDSVYVILGDAEQHVLFYGRATSDGIEAFGSGGGSHEQHRACRASNNIVALTASHSVRHSFTLPEIVPTESGEAMFLRLEIPITRSNSCADAEFLRFDFDLPEAIH